MTRIEKNLLPPDLFSRNTIIAFLIEKLLSDENIRILDVGGYGGKMDYFLKPEINYTILDKREKPGDDKANYKQGYAKKIPFSDNSYEIVLSTDVLEHIDKPDRAPIVRELIRVCKNFIIIGVPCKTELLEKAEKHINEQFKSITGNEHPFLKEHISYGLPSEEKIEKIISKEGLPFMKVREGNLMNWYIQQLYTGVQIGENLSQEKFEFYKFFNENLNKLGNLRAPTYRTFFIINKNGILPEKEIMDDLEDNFVWNSEIFMELLEKAFKDIRNVIDGNIDSKEQMQRFKKELEDVNTNLRKKAEEVQIQEQTIIKARNSVQAYKDAITEARNFLQEKEKTVQVLKGIVAGKDETIEKLESETEKQSSFIQQLNSEINEKEKTTDWLREHIRNNEKKLVSKDESFKSLKQESNAVAAELGKHKESLNEIRNSRAWKTVMIYSKIKTLLWVKPYKLVRKGMSVLIHLGPKVFLTKVIRKIKGKPAIQIEEKPYKKYIEETKVTAKNKKEAKKEIEQYDYKPVISIIVPVYNIEEEWLNKAIKSVQDQWYSRWELCLCDDASTQEHIKPLLKKYAEEDSRIKVSFREHNGGIVKASNDAIKNATGAYVAFLDNDDELTENALYEVVKALQETRYDFIYSDEDKMDMEGNRCDPFFKPDWSPDLLLSHNYTSHFSVYKRKIVEEIGRLREGFDGSQDYDLVLRFTEKTNKIKHIPKILYHWRIIPGSAAAEIEAKPYAFVAGKKALDQAAKRRGISCEISDGLWKGSYRLKRKINGEPLVSIIIPFKDQVGVLKTCLNSIFEKSKYTNYEIILVDNRSEMLETEEYLQSLKGKESVRIYKYDKPFNYSAINNFAAKKAKGEYLLLLNNDTEVISEEWIESMIEYAQRQDVGAVGAKLLFPNNLVQHAGVIMGLSGLANHAFAKRGREDLCYFGHASVVRNYSAVTAACLMVRKDLYNKMGGLDEDNLAVAFNDVDFCLRLREKGYLIVYTPYAMLYHYESLSRGYDNSIKEIQYIRREHSRILKAGDPYYNPNLSLERFDFSLRISDKEVNS